MPEEPRPKELRPEDLAPDGPVTVETWLGAPALSYPRRPASVPAVLERAVLRWPDSVAFVDVDGTAVSYSEFARLVAAAAGRLRDAGLRAGDAVAVASGNCLDLAVLLFACAQGGTIMVGLNTRLAPAQWSYQLAHSRVRLTLATPAYGESLRAAGADTVRPLADVTRSRAPLSAPGDAQPPHAQPSEDSTYAVVYTSGTTGRPKASQVVHRASVHSAMSYQRVLGLRPGERTAVLFPLYYISAMHAHVLPAMLAGASCVLLDTGSPREYVAALARHEISWAYTVPAFLALVARRREFSRARLPALARVAAGGAPFPASLVATLREALPGTLLYDVYGLSETHSPATILRDHEFATKPGSVGRPLPCMQAETRDEHRAPLPAGEPGELWLRGSLVTTGYAGDPAATEQAIVDGWFDTGDIASIDAEGYVYLLDRSKDMINRGGTKVFSAEVEAILCAHPAVSDAAVVGRPDPVGGESVVAFVVPREAGAVSEKELRGWVRDRLAEFAAPREVRLVDTLPRTSIGKTDKTMLRDWARQ